MASTWPGMRVATDGVAQAERGAGGGAPAGLRLEGGGEVGPEIVPDDRNRESDAEKHRGDEADEGEPGVEFDLGAQGHPGGAEEAEEVDAERADQGPQQPADQSEQERLAQHLRGDMAAARPEGLAHGEILHAPTGADEQQVGEINRADDEQEQAAGLEQEEGLSLIHI